MEISQVLDPSCVHFLSNTISQSAPNLTFRHFDFETRSAPRQVHFLDAQLARWLHTRRFSEPTFDPPEPQNIGKHGIRDFSTFSHSLIFFLLTLSLSLFAENLPKTVAAFVQKSEV